MTLKNRKFKFLSFLLAIVAVVSFVGAAAAQTTVFTYQGKLTDGSMPATGTYDMQFRLFDNPNAGQGTQQGATFTNSSVPATGGIFTVQLDFGSAVFATGADLYLEIAVRPAGSTSGYTSLAPRQRLTSAPYAIRALSAAQLGGVAANQYVQTNDSRLTDARQPAAGSKSYIQNTTTLQTGANFNIDGTGAANIFNAQTQYNISGLRVLSLGGGTNLFAGGGTGIANTTGWFNSFVGINTGQNNTDGAHNSFFGTSAGFSNTTGDQNTFVGGNSGLTNDSGSYNTTIGTSSDVSAGYLVNATAIGYGAIVSRSHSLVLGTQTANEYVRPVNVGIGTSAPIFKLHVIDALNTGLRVQNDTAGGRVASFGGFGAFQVDAPSIPGGRLTILENGRVGIGTPAPDQTLTVNGNASKPGGGSWLTFSDERLKNIGGRFTTGLSAVMQLQPIRYQYKPQNALNLDSSNEYIGFGAQAVQKLIPEAVVKTAGGYLQINNDAIIWTMLNAVKEQQAQIERQNQQIKEQQRQVDDFRKIVCGLQPTAKICRQKK